MSWFHSFSCFNLFVLLLLLVPLYNSDISIQKAGFKCFGIFLVVILSPLCSRVLILERSSPLWYVTKPIAV